MRTLFATLQRFGNDMTKKYKQISNKTLKIKEWKDEIIFNYKVIDGISQKVPFGIHICKSSGINKTILIEQKKF